MPRGRAPRPEDFGRYDPTTHTLIIDREASVPPGHPHSPIALRGGERGRLHAVLDSHDNDILQRAARAGSATPSRAQRRRSTARHRSLALRRARWVGVWRRRDDDESSGGPATVENVV